MAQVTTCDICGAPVDGNYHKTFKIKQQRWHTKGFWYWETIDAHDDCIRKLLEAKDDGEKSTTEPIGYWIYETKHPGDYCHCSECGCRLAGKDPLHRHNDWQFNFCPNCGLQMMGVIADD